LPEQINDAPIRAMLHQHIKQSLQPTAIYDDEDVYSLPKAKGNLDFVVLSLTNFDSKPQGLRTNEQTYAYDLVLVAARPSSGTVKAAQVAKANAVLNLLTNEATYTEIGRLFAIGVDFSQLFEKEEPVYTLTLHFSVTVIETRYTR
jgi:hypothetical protein